MLGAYFMTWDARNYGYDFKQSYHPSEMAYTFQQASKIIGLMRDNNAIAAKTTARTRLNSDWVWHNQMAPLFL